MPTVVQLIQYLRSNNHIGSGSPITARDLARHFGISDGGAEVEIRDIIRLAIEQNEIIGSHSRGFYLIGTLAELEENLDSLQSRAENIYSAGEIYSQIGTTRILQIRREKQTYL